MNLKSFLLKRMIWGSFFLMIHQCMWDCLVCNDTFNPCLPFRQEYLSKYASGLLWHCTERKIPKTFWKFVDRKSAYSITGYVSNSPSHCDLDEQRYNLEDAKAAHTGIRRMEKEICTDIEIRNNSKNLPTYFFVLYHPCFSLLLITNLFLFRLIIVFLN